MSKNRNKPKPEELDGDELLKQQKEADESSTKADEPEEQDGDDESEAEEKSADEPTGGKGIGGGSPKASAPPEPVRKRLPDATTLASTVKGALTRGLVTIGRGAHMTAEDVDALVAEIEKDVAAGGWSR